MKKQILILSALFILFVFLSACSKDSSDNSDTNDPLLLGRWQYDESVSIRNNNYYILTFNANGSGSEVVIDEDIVTHIQTTVSNTPFTWTTKASEGKLNFVVNGNTQATTYFFVGNNNQLRIAAYSTASPFIKQ